MNRTMPAPARLLVLALLAAGCSEEPGDEPGPPIQDVERTYATSCRPSGAPAPAPKLKLTRYLSAAVVPSPIAMVPALDGTRAAFLVGQGGKIYRAPDVTKDGGATLWLDISDHVTSGGEMGLLSLALDPQFRTNGRFYVNYTLRTNNQLQTRVSRLRAAVPPTGLVDPKTEQVLLTFNQPYDNHNGGQLAFGPDGYLYVAAGDGGSGGDPGNNAQRMDTLLGKILRIDVSGTGATYRIPQDNPFFTGQPLAVGTLPKDSHCQSAGKAGVCGEIWALGLRNPWRFSFDPLNGALWAGDVGQGEWEEVDVIERGKNYGWKCMEGTHVYVDPQECKDRRNAKAFTAPVSEYSHAEGKSITGGFVYRGKALPALQGTYLFADYQSGAIWGLAPGPAGTFLRSTLFPMAGFFISAFGLDSDGEIYVVDYGGAKLWRIEAAEPTAMGPPGWPERLSETGCFADLAARKLVPGTLSYGVNAPLWSDGADKERAIVLPWGASLQYAETGTWKVPDGTIFIKTFVLGGKAVETRFLIYGNGGGGGAMTEPGAVRGATYRWSDDGRDAVLLSAGLTTRVGDREWVFPSRSECVGCHTKAAGGILGLDTRQMNRRHDVFGTGEVAQIEALARVGYLQGQPPEGAALPRFPDPGDGAADLDARARAYLHGNCAHCHQPGGLSNATVDLRAGTALRDSKACDALAQNGDLGVPGARVIAPGKPEASTLVLRMNTLDVATRMPNISSRTVDAQGVALLRAWVTGLTGCQ